MDVLCLLCSITLSWGPNLPQAASLRGRAVIPAAGSETDNKKPKATFSFRQQVISYFLIIFFVYFCVYMFCSHVELMELWANWVPVYSFCDIR